MADPDHDAESEHTTNARYDDWPIDPQGEYADWPVERATPADHDATDEIASEYAAGEEAGDVEWIGAAGGGTQGETPYLYGPTESTIYRGEIDEENERIVLRKHDEDDEESNVSLGERIEAIGDEHGWSWLSSFAREHLEGDEARPEREGDGREPRATEFNQRNVAESAPYDLSFTGSHTFADESDRAHVLDRRFDVYLDGRGSEEGEATVEVNEDYLVAEAPLEEESRGDAESVGERQYELGIDVDTDDPAWEQTLEDSLREWHASNADWPKRAT